MSARAADVVASAGTLVAMLAAWPAAQTTAPAPPAQQPPVFRAGVEYVPLDVVVTDDQNHPLLDLTKDDFAISENGRPQRIATFSLVSVPPNHRPVDLHSTPPPPRDVVTNTVPPKSRAIVLLIDEGFLRPPDLTRIKQVMVDLLRTLSPDDTAAVVYTKRSDLSQDFTNDVGRLIRAVNHLNATLGWPGDEADTETVFNNAIATLTAAPQTRRAIVYVSELGIKHASPIWLRWREIWNRAERADVHIYMIDPHTLLSPELVKGETAGTPDLDRGISVTADFAQAMAEATGGLAFVNQLNGGRVVNELMTDNGSYYLLGYNPDPFDLDGKFHNVKVTVNRPGARVRARSGYTAPDANSTPPDAGHVLASAMGAGLDTTGLTLRAYAAPVAASAKGMTAIVTVEVTRPEDFSEQQAVEDDLHVSLLALDPDGAVKAETRVPLHFSARTAGGPESRFLIDTAIELPSQSLAFRVGVTSERLGRTGTAHVPIVVPSLHGDALQLGGLVLGLEGSSEPVVGASAITTLVPFQPTTSRTFTPNDTLQFFAPLFWGSKDSSVEVTLAILRQGTSISSRHLAATISNLSGDRHQASVTTSVPLTGLMAGDYVLELAARLPNGRMVRSEVPFEIR
jgi:VWFA-related protein